MGTSKAKCRRCLIMLWFIQRFLQLGTKLRFVWKDCYEQNHVTAVNCEYYRNLSREWRLAVTCAFASKPCESSFCPQSAQLISMPANFLFDIGFFTNLRRIQCKLPYMTITSEAVLQPTNNSYSNVLSMFHKLRYLAVLNADIALQYLPQNNFDWIMFRLRTIIITLGKNIKFSVYARTLDILLGSLAKRWTSGGTANLCWGHLQ